jgi:hypothetical protein
MRSREFVAAAVIVLVAAVSSLTAAGGLAALSLRESPGARQAAPNQTKLIARSEKTGNLVISIMPGFAARSLPLRQGNEW